MTVKELKQELKSRNLKTTGNKSELKERLSEALQGDAANHKNGSNEQHGEDVHDATIKDFEEYINDEFKQLHSSEQRMAPEPTDGTEGHFELPISAPFDESQKMVADFSDVNDDSNSNNDNDNDDIRNNDHPADAETQELPEDKAETVLSEADKVESRKRRFGNLQNDMSPPVKKSRTDPLIQDEERKRIIQRAQKFGTQIPDTITLTKEESSSVYAEQIQRAKRFGTEHLLPMSIQNVEFDAKKNERMKRFNTNAQGQVVGKDCETEKGVEKKDHAKIMERKLRFGTLTETSAQSEQHATHNKKATLEKVSPRRNRNSERIQRFRMYKNHKQNSHSPPKQFQNAADQEKIEERKLRFLK
eukprot:CAMPEP_0202703204 /NCGR_PEP_ID=MMETSP1385-20130828/16069_1 /ASSEMBLY_ACC=CAM_ASM_000861 /TAXON_ID=933848 /ORGANISM="Elphidium margaritaceum" /LENGTH=359 /DNA_ID=CAMNT_0049361007 /DNA_START=83 /DNA_END=1162 /DNA_ORIENTATION=-